MEQQLLSPAQGAGPLYGFALIFDGIGHAVDPDSPEAVRVDGQILDQLGRPVVFPNVLIEFYAEDQFARAQADEKGDWHVVLAKPKSRPHPDGLPQAPYFDVVAYVHPVIEKFQTRMYFPDETVANDQDPVLGQIDASRRGTLVAKPTDTADLRFDIRLRGDDETVFFDYNL